MIVVFVSLKMVTITLSHAAWWDTISDLFLFLFLVVFFVIEAVLSMVIAN